MSMYSFYYLKIIKLFILEKISYTCVYLPGFLLSCAVGNNWQLVMCFYAITLCYFCLLSLVTEAPT